MSLRDPACGAGLPRHQFLVRKQVRYPRDCERQNPKKHEQQCCLLISRKALWLLDHLYGLWRVGGRWRSSFFEPVNDPLDRIRIRLKRTKSVIIGVRLA